MRRTFGVAGVVLAAMLGAAGAAPARGDVQAAAVKHINRLSVEFVGQFQNSAPSVTPATHTHYGYLSYIRGVPAFSGTPANETTALFTFYADSITLRVISDGPLRVITRTGKLTFYRDPSGDATFAKPETFRNGTRILVGTFRQQVVNNTVTGSFTTFHQVMVTSTRPFATAHGKVQLGRVGQAFRIAFAGQGNMPGPPSGFFGGYGLSG